MATAEEARAELARRRSLREAQPAVTPEAARAELQRRNVARTYNPSINDSFVGGIGDTLSAGFMDEAVAGASALLRRPFSDKTLETLYGEALARERARASAEASNNPKARISGQITGGVWGAGRIAPATLSSRLAARGAPMVGRVLAGTAEGTVAGGLYGAGSADDRTSRWDGALSGGLLGGAVGAASPVLASLIGRGVTAVRNAFSAKPIAQSVGARPETLRSIGDIIQSDDLAGAGQANMQRAGAEAMLVDAGPTAQSVLDTAIQRGGAGARIASQRVQQRVGRDAAALTGALDEALGNPKGVTAARSAIRNSSSSTRQTAYNSAYAQPIDYASEQGMRIESLVRDRVPASAIQRANALMRAEGAQSKQIAAQIMDDGTVVFEQLPDVRQIDYITRALNDVAESGEGAGALGGMNTLGRAYSNLSREIRDNLRQAVPQYDEALKVAADPIRRSQAVKLGSEALTARITRDELAEKVAGMTGPERDAFAQGVRSYIDDLMSRVTRTVGDDDTAAREAIAALRKVSSRESRDKLAIALGEERISPMLAEIDRAAQSFNLRAALTGNSRTYARQATAERVADMTAPGAVGTLARGEPVNATKRVVQALTGQTDDAIRARQDAIYSEIADLLTRQGGPDQSVFNAVNQMGETDALTRAIADRLNQNLSSPMLSYPAAQQLQVRRQ